MSADCLTRTHYLLISVLTWHLRGVRNRRELTTDESTCRAHALQAPVMSLTAPDDEVVAAVAHVT